MPILDEQTVRSAVYAAVTDLNETLPRERKIPVAGDTDVFSMIDSLGALNLILRIEEHLRGAAGIDCDLMAGDLYETTLFFSPSLDRLADGVFAVLRA